MNGIRLENGIWSFSNGNKTYSYTSCHCCITSYLVVCHNMTIPEAMYAYFHPYKSLVTEIKDVQSKLVDMLEILQ